MHCLPKILASLRYHIKDTLTFIGFSFIGSLCLLVIITLQLIQQTSLAQFKINTSNIGTDFRTSAAIEEIIQFKQQQIFNSQLILLILIILFILTLLILNIYVLQHRKHEISIFFTANQTDISITFFVVAQLVIVIVASFILSFVCLNFFESFFVSELNSFNDNLVLKNSLSANEIQHTVGRLFESDIFATTANNLLKTDPSTLSDILILSFSKYCKLFLALFLSSSIFLSISSFIQIKMFHKRNSR
ncbi:hypothetical protein LB941_02940 [Ligilactobacillus sp. WILCCON 0076]|uniref:Uncharacterized protein n=1 Tax=Ligilactobacillus ubinensis TaxID=2876789 RepID=A0A9X2FL06_9LACO|nr:hypothetical protein [Ligilactobacillus ubinensis]MCP0886293.1 hypothetical protein [Ligilactobacillus ubinensis]